MLETILYTAHAHTTGGRDGRSHSDDGALDVALSTPNALGGAGADSGGARRVAGRRIFARRRAIVPKTAASSADEAGDDPFWQSARSSICFFRGAAASVVCSLGELLNVSRIAENDPTDESTLQAEWPPR